MIAELLRLNRRFRIPLCPQEWCGSSESHNTGMFPCRGPCGSPDDVAKYFHKSNWIWHLMHYKIGDRFCNIQCDVSFLPSCTGTASCEDCLCPNHGRSYES